MATLVNIIENQIIKFNAGLTKTRRVEIIKRNFRNEVVSNLSTILSSFRNLNLVDIQFLDMIFNLCYYEDCLFDNCIFKNVSFDEAKFKNCSFKNCNFCNCKFGEIDCDDTIFKNCKFSKSNFESAIFESCHFVKPIFEIIEKNFFGSAVLIDSKFSNSKNLIEYKGEIYFVEIFDKINKLYLE